MAKFKSFEEIEAWKHARNLVKDIYILSQTTRLKYDYGLRDQIQRAAVSVMSNIAEGFERNSYREFIHFLYIARGSCAEVKSQLYVLIDLNYIDERTFKNLYDRTSQISKALLGLINYLKNANNSDK
ncbi:four helix bundle protein [Anaerosolibacter carboniphilus]|uniref:Four helix bundle protein n=1 Tax=Anaerosolibacter carboniphilus TaxID=1417629 RepID=A0A841KZS3_9FIRM|nr:four helix bundle protein [Anaerosolibacter carboniphilus]MBB6216412.1 four helix bundle protein [Anaerosolibacter carboniphilus]